MINIFSSDSRYTASHGWLLSKFSFSFAEYFDRNNLNFGPLRVFNDDIIQPDRGFGFHPHREMEIVSVVVKGELQHRDDMGNTEVLRPGEVQRMSAGTGVVHSEMNPSTSEEVNLLQLWFEPNEFGLEPSYEQISYSLADMKNALLPVVSNKNSKSGSIAHIHQDMTIYLSELEAGQSLVFTQPAGRKIYFFVIEGEAELNSDSLLKLRDAARITDTPTLDIRTKSGATFMLIDLP